MYLKTKLRRVLTPLAHTPQGRLARDVALLGRLFPLIPLGLAFFGVFYTRPPKTLKHVAITTLCIFIISSLPLLTGPLSVLGWNFGAFYLLALSAWLASAARDKLTYIKSDDPAHIHPRI